MKRKICEIVEKEKDIKFDYELLIENCNNMYDILNDISEMYKPEENNTTIQSNTDSKGESVTKKIKKMKIDDNITYI